VRAVERGSGWVRPSDDATYHLGMISEDEKVEIARKHLIPHAIAKHGLKDGEWAISDEALLLKNRTLSPVVERFIECAREVAKPFAKASDPERSAGH